MSEKFGDDLGQSLFELLEAGVGDEQAPVGDVQFHCRVSCIVQFLTSLRCAKQQELAGFGTPGEYRRRCVSSGRVVRTEFGGKSGDDDPIKR